VSDFNSICEELIIHLGGVLPPKSSSKRYRQALVWALKSRIPYLEVRVFDLNDQARMTIMDKPITCFGDFLILDLGKVFIHSDRYFHPKATD
jgi:hypothetical protein